MGTRFLEAGQAAPDPVLVRYWERSHTPPPEIASQERSGQAIETPAPTLEKTETAAEKFIHAS
jgi:hypothetical protein